MSFWYCDVFRLQKTFEKRPPTEIETDRKLRVQTTRFLIAFGYGFGLDLGWILEPPNRRFFKEIELQERPLR